MISLLYARKRCSRRIKVGRMVLSLFFCIFLLVGTISVPQPVVAYDSYEGEDFVYMLEGKKATIVDTSLTDENLVVPETVDGYKVVAIDSRAFSKSDFRTITLPDSVTSIGNAAFAWSESLEKVVLPAKLEEISRSCFSGCESLTEVKFGSKITTIGADAFYKCTSLKTINLPSSLEEIKGGAFRKCIALKDINFNNKLEIIGDRAFQSANRLKSVALPSSIKVVKERVFEDCIDLEKVVFNSNKTRLGEGVFRECSSLKSVKLPKGLRNIPVRAFYMCENLEEIKLPSKVSIIKKEAFADCVSLKDVVINKKTYAIGDRAFAGSGITKLKLNDNMQFIGNGAFRDTKLRSMKLGDKVTFIGSRIFSGCNKLKSIYIPSSVKGINIGAFSGCTSLEAINVASGNKSYCSVDGVLYNETKTKLLQYPINKKNSSYTSPRGMDSVRNYAFEGNSHLTTVNVDAKVIGHNAFMNMKRLKNVTLSSTVVIKRYAFAENSKLTNVRLADSTATIDYGVFKGTNIRTINLPSKLTYLGGDVFSQCKNLASFTGSRSPKFAVQDGVLYNAAMTRLIKYPAKKSDKSFSVPDSVVSIRLRAFENTNKLRKLYFGTGTKRLEYEAVYKAKRLKTVMFYCKKLSHVSSYAIVGCNNLAVIVGPNNWSLRNLAEGQNATFISA